MSRDPFAGALDPFAYWDISATYDKYSAFFDLVIYCAVFIALCHVVFTRRFTGRAGKAMATAIGLALGISLAVAGRSFGFSLRQAGPIAVFIALLLVGFLILHTMLRVHVQWKLAAPLTYVLIYLFVRAVSPALFGLIAARIPFVNLLSAVIFLICVWQVGVALWPKGEGHGRGDPSDSSFISGLDRKDEKREIKVEKKIKRRLTPQAQRETARLTHSLEALQKELQKGTPDWKSMEEALSGIAHRSDDVIRTVDRIRVLDRRLRNFDWHELQELGSYYNELNDSDRERLKEQILLERRKIVQEHAIVGITERCERRHRHLRDALDQASKACSIEDRQGAAQHIGQAIHLEEQQKSDLKEMRRAEKRLLSLTKKKLRKEKS
jgi:hypothetical protein